MGTIEQAIQQKKFNTEQQKANINILYTANWLHSKITNELKPYDLTLEQFNVLRILRGAHPDCICQKEILSRMVAPSSNVTLLIKKLVKKELVTVSKSERDKREYEINISKKGLEKLTLLDENLPIENEEFLGISESEAFHLNSLLDKLRL